MNFTLNKFWWNGIQRASCPLANLLFDTASHIASYILEFRVEPSVTMAFKKRSGTAVCAVQGTLWPKVQIERNVFSKETIFLGQITHTPCWSPGSHNMHSADYASSTGIRPLSPNSNNIVSTSDCVYSTKLGFNLLHWIFSLNSRHTRVNKTVIEWSTEDDGMNRMIRTEWINRQI